MPAAVAVLGDDFGQDVGRRLDEHVESTGKSDAIVSGLVIGGLSVITCWVLAYFLHLQIIKIRRRIVVPVLDPVKGLNKRYQSKDAQSRLKSGHMSSKHGGGHHGGTGCALILGSLPARS